MYADYAYYQGTYHGTALTEAQWPAAAREADAWLDRLTLGRLQRGAPVDDAVRMAACAMAEVAGRYQTAAAERTPGLASATNDGYSESYAGTAADLAAQEQTELQAAADLYSQLPLTIEVEDYSTNEKIFYPPEELDTGDAPEAAGGAGVLAYYEPWGDVVLFYDDFGTASGLHELGTVTSGSENISELSGSVRIEQAEEAE